MAQLLDNTCGRCNGNLNFYCTLFFCLYRNVKKRFRAHDFLLIIAVTILFCFRYVPVAFLLRFDIANIIEIFKLLLIL